MVKVMIPQLPPAQITNTAMHMTRLAPAGARGIASVGRDVGVEQINEKFGYQPGTDGTLFNAFIDQKNGHGAPQGGGQRDQNPHENSQQARARNAGNGAARDASDAIDLENVRFADFLDFDGPLDLGARRSPQSIYAMVNAVTHGAVPLRGQRLDFHI
jgi:hypothetical protein|tara:strand:- start:26923 stop:27396 length:474 start_codon:yes stop_codon:yes gene_type:complete